MYKKFNRNIRRMQGGGQPVQQGAPQMVPVPQQQPQRPHMNVQQQQPQGPVDPKDKALAMVIEQNERLKQQLQMQQIQMQKMAMIMEGKTPPSEARTSMGAKNTPKRKGGAIKKRKKY